MNLSNIKYTNSFPAIDSEIEALFKSVPASGYCKDKKGKYLEVNDVFIHTSAHTKASQLVGHADSDLPWKDQAHLMMQNDKQIIHSNKTGIFIENAFCIGDKIRYFISYKLPLLNRLGKKLGIIGSSFLLDDIHIVSGSLKNAGFFLNYHPADLLNAQKQQELTPRQIDCLICLVKGMTVKQISKQLNLSPKTVEHYLAATRKKLNCYSRYELITKALQIPYIKNCLI